MKRLLDHGIEVIHGVLENECRKMNEVFLKYITTKKPFMILKTAMTLDGKISTRIGDSKWITNEKSRAFVHEIRNQVMAIMVGIDTVLTDNPKLTTRLKDKRSKDPIRIIVDSKGRLPLDSNVIVEESNAHTIIATTQLANQEKIKMLEKAGVEVIITPLKDNRVDLVKLMEILGKKNTDSILLEGGSTLNFSALKEGIVDKVYQFIAPKIIGGSNASTPVGGEGFKYIKDAIKLKDISYHTFDEDLLIEGYLRKE